MGEPVRPIVCMFRKYRRTPLAVSLGLSTICYNPQAGEPVPPAIDNGMSERLALNVCKFRTYTQKPFAVSLSLSAVLFHIHTGEPVPPAVYIHMGGLGSRVA